MSGKGSIVISGASTGIGHACALRLDRLGYEVIAGVRRPEDGAALKEQSSGRLSTAILDITQQADIAALAASLGERKLHGLVNNAGIAVAGPLEFTALDDLRGQLEVNVVGTLALTQALIPFLRAARGRIVNIGSVGGRTASPFLGPYSASKYAVEAITDSLRQELRPWGIQVSVIEPGAIATPMWDKGKQSAEQFNDNLPPAGLELYSKPIQAMQRLADQMAARAVSPERVARAVEHALGARRSRTRYVVGIDARAQLLIKALLPTRAADALVARVMGV